MNAESWRKYIHVFGVRFSSTFFSEASFWSEFSYLPLSVLRGGGGGLFTHHYHGPCVRVAADRNVPVVENTNHNCIPHVLMRGMNPDPLPNGRTAACLPYVLEERVPEVQCPMDARQHNCFWCSRSGCKRWVATCTLEARSRTLGALTLPQVL